MPCNCVAVTVGLLLAAAARSVIAFVPIHGPTPANNKASAVFRETDATTCTQQGVNFNGGYNVSAVLNVGLQHASKTYEFGTYSQTLLELYNPELTVFDTNAFPGGAIPSASSDIKSLTSAKQYIDLDNTTLAVEDDNHPATPATLGVAAILLGQFDEAYMDAATAQVNHLLNDVPRMANGAISTDASLDKAWSDWVYEAPPFLAYYAVATNNASLLNFTVDQIGLYRDYLVNQDNSTKFWHHVAVNNSHTDVGFWALGNGYAAAGMAKVLATIVHWNVTSRYTDQISQLKGWIKELTDAVKTTQREDGSELIYNYMNSNVTLAKFGGSFEETSGTALLASAFYRMLLLAPELYDQTDLDWADQSRYAIVGNTYSNADDSESTLLPSVNSDDASDLTKIGYGNTMNQNAGGLLYAAYRDCVCAGRCTQDDGKRH